jgi:putative addiction module component (TIGR02574 family)
MLAGQARRHGSLWPMAIDSLRDGVLALPEEERAELAAALLASLGPEPEPDQNSVDQAWAAELDRRAAALESGEDPGVAWEDALSQARQRLAE